MPIKYSLLCIVIFDFGPTFFVLTKLLPSTILATKPKSENRKNALKEN